MTTTDRVERQLSDKTREKKQQANCRERDGWKCCFERLAAGRWRTCGSTSVHGAHIIRRSQLSREAKFHDDMILRACLDCHRTYDAYEATVRVPIERARRAWQVANELCNAPPPKRYDPEFNKLYLW